MRSSSTLALTPIGYIHTTMVNKFDAPCQPDNSVGGVALIKLNPKQDLHKALEDLDGFEHIWLLWWFHKNSTWRPKVRPPRGEGIKRGLFATRSPHRPNPIGMTAVRLISIDHLEIQIGDCDLIDGTPILDIKPYLPVVDSYPDSKTGWLEDVDRLYKEAPKYKVTLTNEATRQMSWLKERGVNFFDRAIKILEIDPSVNRTRRITRLNNGFKMGCAEWRIVFSICDNGVTVEYFTPGYSKMKLISAGSEAIIHRDTQLEFYSKFQSSK